MTSLRFHPACVSARPNTLSTARSYQSLNMQLNSMKHQLRDYYEERR